MALAAATASTLRDSRILTFPNFITFSRVALAVPACIALVERDAITLCVLCVLAALTDYLDGWAARRYRSESLWGIIGDPLADKIFVDTLYVVLWWEGFFLPYFGFALVFVTVVYDARMIWVRVREYRVSGSAAAVAEKMRPSLTAKRKTAAQFLALLGVGTASLAPHVSLFVLGQGLAAVALCYVLRSWWIYEFRK